MKKIQDGILPFYIDFIISIQYESIYLAFYIKNGPKKQYKTATKGPFLWPFNRASINLFFSRSKQ